MLFRRVVLYTTCLLFPLISLAKPLEVWIMPNGANPQGIMEERLEAFKRETGLQAKVVVLDWGEAWSRIHKALETGEGPDVIQLGTTWCSYFASKGWLANLDTYLNQIKPERFAAVSWSTVKVDGDHSVYAIPWFMDVRVLMGNRAQLERAQITGDQLQTMDDFRRALYKIRKTHLERYDGSVIAPFAFPGKSDWNIPHNFAPWVWSEGGDFIKKVDGQWRSNLMDARTVIGIRRYIGFVLDTLMNRRALKENSAQVTGRFNNGEQIFAVNTSEVIMQTRVDESEGGTLNAKIGQEGILTFPIPAGAGGSVAFIGGSNLALPKVKASNAKALKLLMFLTRADNLDKYTRKIGFLPPDESVLEVWSQDALYKVIIDATQNGRVYPNIPNWGQIESMLVEMFSAVWTLLDAVGLYTDEELYKILYQYNDKINASLNASPGQTVNLEEFQRAIASIPTLQNLINPKDTTLSSASQSALQTPSILDNNTLVFALIGLFILAIGALIIQKSKKHES